MDWWQRLWGCRLLVRLPSSVFRFVLVMVSLVVQTVGGVGDAVVGYWGGGVGRGTRIQVVCEGDVAFGRRCWFWWCC